MNTIRCARAASLTFVVLLAATAAPARAAESYDACSGTITSLPTSIATQGTWCLKGDLATTIATGEAIAINTNNVTIDCNGFKLGGLGAGTGTGTTGILAVSRSNITVRNCAIRGFKNGIRLVGGGGGHRIVGNRLDGNTTLGIAVDGDGSRIEGNAVLDTGGAASTQFMTVGIIGNGDVNVIDNQVRNVTGTPASGFALGLRLENAAGGSIRANQIASVFSVETGGAFMLNVFNSNGVAVRDNDLFDSSGATYGVLCQSGGNNIVTRNIVVGAIAAVSGCVDAGDNLSPP